MRTVNLAHQRGKLLIHLDGLRLLRLAHLRLFITPDSLAVLLHEQIVILVVALLIHAFNLRVKGVRRTVNGDLGPRVNRFTALGRNAGSRNRLCVKADLTSEVSKACRPRVAVALVGLKHISRGGQRPVALRSVSRADAEIAERILRVIIHRTQLLLLGHAVLDNALYCRSQQRVQFGRAGDVVAVVVKLERADELVMVKLLVLIDMEQLAANVMPARRQIGGLLIE